MQSTLRQLQAHLGDRRIIAALAVAALLVGLVGPFDTFDRLALAPRLAYWTVLVFLTYAVGTLTALVVEGRLAGRLGRWPLTLVSGLVAGLPVAAIVLAVNFALYGPGAATTDEIALLAVYCPLISACIVAFQSMIAEAFEEVAPAEPPAPPPILERLAPARRGRLLALSVADHYVSVATDRGETLVLMRLSDAIREAGSVQGVQIHRSHWVASEAVRASGRSGGRVWVELETGARLPVSRSFLPAARAARLVA